MSADKVLAKMMSDCKDDIDRCFYAFVNARGNADQKKEIIYNAIKDLCIALLIHKEYDFITAKSEFECKKIECEKCYQLLQRIRDDTDFLR